MSDRVLSSLAACESIHAKVSLVRRIDRVTSRSGCLPVVRATGGSIVIRLAYYIAAQVCYTRGIGTA